MDADAVVVDPRVPADVVRLLEKAPARRLVPFGAPAPAAAAVPPPPGRRERVLTPQGRQAASAVALLVVFGLAGIVAWIECVAAANPLAAEAAGMAGIVLTAGFFGSFAATVSTVNAADASGWRRLIQDPEHPAWIGMHAVTAYHRRYVAPARDIDEQARAAWTRAVGAASRLKESEVVRLGLVDSVQVTTVLPYHLWEIAERLARVSALRAQHEDILRGVDANDTDVATLLGPQRRAHELANADIERRVAQLELFAELTGQADAARRRERAVRRLATLNDSHAELLAHIGQGTAADSLAEQVSVDVQAIIDQANEAVRQANEAGRDFVLPGTEAAC